MAEQTLTVRVVGDERDYLRALRSSAGATQRFSLSLGNFVKGALVFEGVRAGVQALTSIVRSGIDEFSEMQKVQAQTQAALKSTGGIAGVTARDVENLAGRLSSLSGIDDELIQSSQNLLLTFTNIRNEVGKGNAIFDRAAQAVLNLNVRGFGPLDSVAKQVGKALQDPIRGLTSLARAGVQFTQRQRDVIKGFVETGRVAGAQNVILREIERQVGGSAKALGDTLPGQLNKLRNAFRNAFGNLVAVVAGPLGRAFGAVAGFVPKIEQSVERISATVGPALDAIVTRWLANAGKMREVAEGLLEPFRQRVLPVVRELAQTLVNAWSNVVQVFSENREKLAKILDDLGAALGNVWAIARPTIVFLLEKVLPKAVDIAIRGIAALAAVTRVLSEVWVRVVSTIVKALDVFLGVLTRVTDAASRLPFVGDQFKGISDKVNASRESLRAFSDQLDAIDGRKVSVSITVDVTTGRREEGALGRSSDVVSQSTEKVTKTVTKGLNDTTNNLNNVTNAANQTTTATNNAKTAAERQREAFDALMATIGLRRDRAAATAGLKDDIAAAVATKKALEEQLKVQKGNVDLQRQLLQANQELADLRRQQRQGRQFEALGLTAEGQQRIPGVGALRNRLGNLREQIKGTVLDTAKTRSQLNAIANVLSGQFGAVGRRIREAILQMYNDISGALDSGGKNGGPETKFQKGGFGKLIENATGLTPEQIKAIRQSFAQFGAGGTVPGKGFGAFGVPFPAAVSAPGGGGAIIIENRLFIDGVEQHITRQQQIRRERTAPQRRGTKPGI